MYENIDVVVLLIMSLAISFTYSISRKVYTARVTGSFAPIFMFNAVSAVASILTLLIMGGIGKISLFTLALGLLFGLATLVQQVTTLEALRTGPLALTTTIVSCSTVIPAVSGALFFGEQLKIAHIIGILLMLASFFFAVEREDGGKKASWRWFLFCMIAFIATGSIGTMQKIHQNTEYKGELNGFLIIAFLFSFVASAVAYVSYIVKNRNIKTEKVHTPLSLWLIMLALMIISGVSFGAVNNLNLYLSGVMESAVFFPIVNGGGLVLTTLAAFLIFRERLSLKQWVGVVLGIASVIFLCNPFG